MSAEKKKVLGRGLASLIPSARSVSAAVAPATEEAVPSAVVHGAPVVIHGGNGAESGERVLQVPVEAIERNPYQPRQRVGEAALEELAASIRASGIMQPIVLRYIVAPQAGAGSVQGVPAEAAEGRKAYQLIAGERRWLAAQRAGLKTVPAIVRQCSNEQTMELAIIENLQREDLNPLEQAMAFDRLGREFGLTQEQIAQKTGKDRTTISNYVRMLRLPVETQAAITLGQISFGHAKVLMALESADLILDATKRVLDGSLSVRQTEDMVHQILELREKEAKEAKPVDPNVREAERRLEQVLGTRVRIKDSKGRGKLVIEYHTLDDFDRILEALGAAK